MEKIEVTNTRNIFFNRKEKVHLSLTDGFILYIFDVERNFYSLIFSNEKLFNIEEEIKKSLKEFKRKGSSRENIQSKLVSNHCESSIIQNMNSCLRQFGINIQKSYDFEEESIECQFSGSQVKYRINNTEARIKVLIVEDSKVIQKILKNMIDSDERFEVVGISENPIIALTDIKKHAPDILTLDIHMPQMDGVSFLEKHMEDFNLPSIIVSSALKVDKTLYGRALQAGAFECLEKPTMNQWSDHKFILINTLQAAYQAFYDNKKRHYAANIPTSNHLKFSSLQKKIILIGASTGGTEAIATVLKGFPKKIPPIVIVLHIPKGFSKLFADRMNGECPFQVSEVSENTPLEENNVYIAPGGKHLKLRLSDTQSTFLEISDAPSLNHFKPSVDYLFLSLKRIYSWKIAACILTGMGNDGTQGMIHLKNLGAHTFAQDEKTSLVYGMPRAAYESGSVDDVKPIHEIAESITRCFNKI